MELLMCDCLTPIKPHKCLNCFIEHLEEVKKYCGIDKEDAWEGIALEQELMIEDAYDRIIPDEIYSLVDTWT